MDRHATIHAGNVYHVANQPSPDGTGQVVRGLYAPDAVLVAGQYLPGAVHAELTELAAAAAPKQLAAGTPALPRGNPEDAVAAFLAAQAGAV